VNFSPATAFNLGAAGSTG